MRSNDKKHSSIHKETDLDYFNNNNNSYPGSTDRKKKWKATKWQEAFVRVFQFFSKHSYLQKKEVKSHEMTRSIC